jgi:hypothetical protein
MEVIYLISVVLLFAIFIGISYFVMYYEVLRESKKESAHYEKNKLRQLLLNAIKVLTDKANTIAHPYFFNQPIEYIFSTVPSIYHVFRFCKYKIENPESSRDLHFILLEEFGDRFEECKELNVLVRVNTSEFGVQEYFHYLLEDIEQATNVYLKNKRYIDKLLYS